jgi:hypothetical protein
MTLKVRRIVKQSNRNLLKDNLYLSNKRTEFPDLMKEEEEDCYNNNVVFMNPYHCKDIWT